MDQYKISLIKNLPVQFSQNPCLLEPEYFIGFEAELDKFNCDDFRMFCFMKYEDELVAFVLLSRKDFDPAVVRFMYTMPEWRWCGAITEILEATFANYGPLIADPVDVVAVGALKKANFRIHGGLWRKDFFKLK